MEEWVGNRTVAIAMTILDRDKRHLILSTGPPPLARPIRPRKISLTDSTSGTRMTKPSQTTMRSVMRLGTQTA